jgi:hypothetical protein
MTNRGNSVYNVPCWRYLLRITDSATQSFTLSLFPDFTVGITIALLQPVLTLTALTMALPLSILRLQTEELSNSRRLSSLKAS